MTSHTPTAAASPAIRLLIATPAYAPLMGGAEKMVEAVAERLVERGYHVTILTLDVRVQQDFVRNRGAGLPARAELNGVDIVRVSPRRGWLHQLLAHALALPGFWRLSMAAFGPAFDYWFPAPSALRMRRPLHHLPADVIISSTWYFSVAYWAAEAARDRGIPHIALPFIHMASPWVTNPCFPGMFAGCSATMVLTEAEGGFVSDHGGRNVVVTGAGVDPAALDQRNGAELRTRFGIGKGPVVGFMGRQDRDKGAPTLIDAMRIVWQSRPDVTLLLAGTPSRRDAETTDRLRGLTPDELVKVALVDDFVDDDKASILDACDMLALPSVEDAFGIVLAEAWICGKPVIAGDIPSSRCIVDDGVDGFLVAPFDAVALAGRIIALIQDDAMRAEFGRRGRAKVLSRWTWDQVTDQWEAAIRLARSATS